MELDRRVKDPVQVGLGGAAARVKELTPIMAARGRSEGTLLVMVQTTLLEEIKLFAQEMGYKTLGIATCIGLINEAPTIVAYLKNDFEVLVANCKNGGLLKSKPHPYFFLDKHDVVLIGPASFHKKIAFTQEDIVQIISSTSVQ
ncbi:MAG: DUF1847 domain-containing protein [Syntrophomonas sp.]|nr:DUF1847 domain-containing protein [Syntrophomonas sp.]